MNISISLLRLASDLNISEPLGQAPNDLFLSRYPYGHPHSLLTEWTERVLPMTVQEKGRVGPKIIFVQAGSMRFDLVCTA